MFRALLRCKETRRTFTNYVTIGVAGVALYFLLLWGLDSLGLWPPIAFTLSYVVATAAQFLLNKYLNFRSFERPIRFQASTYVAVALVNYGVMIVVEEFGVIAMRLTPMEAYALSIPVNLPIAYLANRFLTFGPGIFGAIRAFRRRSRS